MTISVVTPCFNEADCLPHYFGALIKNLKQYKDFEVVMIDDGSTDNSLQIMVDQHHKDNRFKVIELARNFGKEAALSAGLDHAKGDCIIILDADLQDPPELIPKMISIWQNGADVVMGRRQSRSSDSKLKRWTAGWFYKCFNTFSEQEIPANVGDFRLIDKTVLLEIRKLTERNRFMKGLLSWPGFEIAFLDYERPARVAGKTKWSYTTLISLAFNGIFSFSIVPLRMAFLAGLGASVFTLIYAVITIIKTIIIGVDVPGYASLMVVSLTFFGLVLICLGIIGEYLGRIYIEVKARPIYVIRSRF